MLMIITDSEIVINPRSIFCWQSDEGTFSVTVWNVEGRANREIHIAENLTEEEAKAVYDKIADYIAAGVTALDLRTITGAKK